VWGNQVSPRPCPREGFALKRGIGNPGFPMPPPAGGCGRAQPSSRGMGNPGFPIPPFASGVAPPGGIDGYREHRLLEQGDGEPGFPHAPTRGRVWEGAALPGTTVCSSRRCARVAWTATVNIGCSPTRMRRCPPPPDLPPLGGGAGLPPPSGGRAGEGGRHRARGDATRADRPRSQVMFIGRGAAEPHGRLR